MNLFVSNFPFATTEDELADLFAEFGDVNSAKIITDRDTGRSRGFGFVDMNESGGNQAIANLDCKDFQGRTLHVNVAREREPREQRSGAQRGRNRDR